MSKTITINPACVRDVSYVFSHLRPADAMELDAMLTSEGAVDTAALAESHVRGSPLAWTVVIDDVPVCAFGAGPVFGATWMGWSFGTDRMPRAVPKMMRRIEEMKNAAIGLGCRRLEARALAGNHGARRWLRQLGAAMVLEMPGAGRRGETLELWTWVAPGADEEA